MDRKQAAAFALGAAVATPVACLALWSYLDGEKKKMEAELSKAKEEAAFASKKLIHFRGGERKEKAAGELRGVNGMNRTLWAMKHFKHEPPRFRYFDPELSEHMQVLFKEIRLPRSEQTHEVVYEPVSKCVFVSQMSNSVLVRIPVGEDGLMIDDQDAWMIGPEDKKGDGLAGLHNVSLSHKHPGCIWLSLQFCNMLLLVEAATMRLRHVLKVPTMLVREDKSAIRIGGPHAVREAPGTGEIWVALKGSVACHPAETPDLVKATGSKESKSLKRAVDRVCCSSKALRSRMEKLAELGYNTPPPEGFAVWRVDPDKYDPNAGEAFGGRLYECKPSPPMLAIDKNGDVWVAQDQDECVMKIEAATHKTYQFDVPHPPKKCDKCMRITGPAISTAPDGGVWMALLGGDGCFCRVDPVTGGRSLYEFERPAWLKRHRVIHHAFHTHHGGWCIFRNKKIVMDKLNVLYAISSNLIDDDALNMLTVYIFNGDSWTDVWCMKSIPLPTQDCSCHRIDVIADGLRPEDQSIVISELHTSKLFQMKIHNTFNSGLDMLQEIEQPGKPEISPVDGTVLQRHIYKDKGGLMLSKTLCPKIGTEEMHRKTYRALELAWEREDGMMDMAGIANIDLADCKKKVSF